MGEVSLFPGESGDGRRWEVRRYGRRVEALASVYWTEKRRR